MKNTELNIYDIKLIERHCSMKSCENCPIYSKKSMRQCVTKLANAYINYYEKQNNVSECHSESQDNTSNTYSNNSPNSTNSTNSPFIDENVSNTPNDSTPIVDNSSDTQTSISTKEKYRQIFDDLYLKFTRQIRRATKHSYEYNISHKRKTSKVIVVYNPKEHDFESITRYEVTSDMLGLYNNISDIYDIISAKDIIQLIIKNGSQTLKDALCKYLSNEYAHDSFIFYDINALALNYLADNYCEEYLKVLQPVINEQINKDLCNKDSIEFLHDVIKQIISKYGYCEEI